MAKQAIKRQVSISIPRHSPAYPIVRYSPYLLGSITLVADTLLSGRGTGAFDAINAVYRSDQSEGFSSDWLECRVLIKVIAPLDRLQTPVLMDKQYQGVRSVYVRACLETAVECYGLERLEQIRADFESGSDTVSASPKMAPKPAREPSQEPRPSPTSGAVEADDGEPAADSPDEKTDAVETGVVADNSADEAAPSPAAGVVQSPIVSRFEGLGRTGSAGNGESPDEADDQVDTEPDPVESVDDPAPGETPEEPDTQPAAKPAPDYSKFNALFNSPPRG